MLDVIGVEYKDLQSGKVEDKLSKLGALVSLANDDVSAAEESVRAAKAKLEKIQAEIEQLYITLDEPFLYVME